MVFCKKIKSRTLNYIVAVLLTASDAQVPCGNHVLHVEANSRKVGNHDGQHDGQHRYGRGYKAGPHPGDDYRGWPGLRARGNIFGGFIRMRREIFSGLTDDDSCK